MVAQGIQSPNQIIARSGSAPLPKAYENAKTALAQCERIDECKEWANKAEALASYARQSNDDTLEKTAMKIKARAIRRCGELLKELDRPEQGGRPPKQNDTGTGIVSVKQAAENAGLSKRQKDTAIQVANVPQKSFDAQVESDNPPTITELAEQGKKSRPKPLVDLDGRKPADFSAATQAQGTIKAFADFCADADWDAVYRGTMGNEMGLLKCHVEKIFKHLEYLRRIL